MALDVFDSRGFEELDESEQPRFWECFQCIYCLTNAAKMSKEEKRFTCILLDGENVVIGEENERIMNPTMRKPLKKCIYHPEEAETKYNE